MSMKQNKLVALENAGVSYSGKWLVRGVTMSVDTGEIVTLIGPNGSGKSTTAKMALGVLKNDEGKAYRQDHMRVSYVPQTLTIDWTLPLSVSRFLSLTKSVNKEDVEKALYSTETLHLANSAVRTLSGGEFQRVLLARAIVSSPQLLVLDEPVQGVDFNGEIALYKLIEKIRRELNCGILLISHDLHVVMSATDRVICLNGHVCCSGTPASVISNPEFRALFGERAAAELTIYEHTHDHEHLADGSIKQKRKNTNANYQFNDTISSDVPEHTDKTFGLDSDA